MPLEKQTQKPEIKSFIHYRVRELFDQLLISLGEVPENQRKEIPLKYRTHIIPTCSSEEKEKRIKRIQASLFEKYGTTEGVIFLVTNVTGPWDDLQS